MSRDYSQMTISELQELRVLVWQRMGEVPTFRRGSLQVGYRKCGKPNCRCAREGEQGHGPRGLWTRTAKGTGGSRGQYIPMAYVDQVREELAHYQQFEQLVEDYVEINEALAKAQIKPPGKNPRAHAAPAGTGGEKRGSKTPTTAKPSPQPKTAPPQRNKG